MMIFFIQYVLVSLKKLSVSPRASRLMRSNLIILLGCAFNTAVVPSHGLTDQYFIEQAKSITVYT